MGALGLIEKVMPEQKVGVKIIGTQEALMMDIEHVQKAGKSESCAMLFRRLGKRSDLSDNPSCAHDSMALWG